MLFPACELCICCVGALCSTELCSDHTRVRSSQPVLPLTLQVSKTTPDVDTNAVLISTILADVACLVQEGVDIQNKLDAILWEPQLETAQNVSDVMAALVQAAQAAQQASTVTPGVCQLMKA